MKDLPTTEKTASMRASLEQTIERTETADKKNGNSGHKAHSGHLTSGRLLARNTVWNLLGSGAPMIVAVFCIPILIRGLGTDRFGILTLAWALIGYASLFDLGLGRALTQLVAKKLGAGEDRDVPTLVWTTLLLMLILGVAGSTIIILFSPWLVHSALNVPDPLEPEVLRAFYLLGLSIPVVISTAGLRGLLEAYQRFVLINALRIPLGVFTFAGPLLVLPFSKSLVPVVATLVAGRIAAWAAHLLLCLRVTSGLGARIAWQTTAVRPLLRFGGWMTVSNLIGPLMFYMDRFLIGAMLSVSAVAYYAAPFDMISRLTVVPTAVVGVLFPAFALSFVQDRGRTGLLLNSALKYIFMVTFPIILTIVALAPEGLKLWLGTSFAEQGTSVLRWLAAGVFVVSLSTLPFVLIQSTGRPEIAAKLHAAELVPYWVALWLLTRELGIVGSAIAWTGRLGLEALLLFFFSHRLLPQQPKFLLRLGVAVAGGLTALYFISLPGRLVTRACFLTAGLLVFGLACWLWGLAPRERIFLFGAPADAPTRAHTNSI